MSQYPPVPPRRSRRAEHAQEAEQDFSAYYSREGAQENAAQPSFAPPPRMSRFLKENEAAQPQENVYRPLETTWADSADQDIPSDGGYHVQDEAPPEKTRKHSHKGWLVLALAVMAVGICLMFLPVSEWLEGESALQTETPQPAVTPEPVRAYDAVTPYAMTDQARNAIGSISGTVPMEEYIVTETNVATRTLRSDGKYDFYLFTAQEGRLLCYFEGLEALDMLPQTGGSFYVAQSPYLIASDGSAMIRTADVEAQIGEKVHLHPLYGGWAVLESEADGSTNYINPNGQLLSSLWFSRALPFTGEYTIAYADMGSTAEASQRYLLYVLSKDGDMTRWFAADDHNDILTCALGMAYMKNGDLYRLDDVAAPMLRTSEIRMYLDCGAAAVKDPESGKWGLFVNGEQHYGYVYDRIEPVESDLVWQAQTHQTDENACTLYAVSGASYPQPLSYSFVLEKEGQCEYVALSSLTSCPIRLDGEF